MPRGDSTPWAIVRDEVCGIAGKVSSRGAVPAQLVEAMCAAQVHRGPDSRGIHASDGAVLGIQRLRIIDLETGDQPIYNEDRSVAVVLNGEIYNYRELRRELERRGHRFATNGDTEVIAHLYEDHGADLVHQLSGMFAFAIWDAQRRRLLLARDRVGKKPLFYCERDGGLAFASELDSLMRDPEIPREVDPTSIDCYLAYGYIPAPRLDLARREEAAAGAHAGLGGRRARASSATGASTTRAKRRGAARRARGGAPRAARGRGASGG